MPDRLGSICAYLDYSIPEIRGEHVHFTASSGGNEMQVCMSRCEARKMAAKTIRLLDAADRDQAMLVEMRRWEFHHAAS